MDKLEKPVKGKNIKYLLDAFFNKYIRKHFNEVHSIDFIISDLGERMDDGGRNIKILRNDNPVRTNNPDWFPPKAQQTDHICTFLKQLMDNNLGTKDSYVGLKVDVVSGDTVYTWDVRAVDYYENSGTVILKTDPRQGVSIQCPAIVRLYIYPLLTSKAISSIVYDSIVTKESKYNFILGERNIHKGEDNVWIFGKNNISRESNHNSLIDGYNNDVDSYGNIVIGDSNKHCSVLGATIGKFIKNFKQNSFLFGEGHDNSNGPSYEAVFGKYSKIEADTLFAIGDGVNENNRHNLFELKRGGAILDKDGNDIRNSSSQVQSDWNETDGSKPAYIKNKPNISSPMVEITWGALKTLRDRSELIPGVQYRITNYSTTMVHTNTRSAGHQFDIIVIADDVNKLNENARACLHQGDTYFINCKLEAWQLKYCLDNKQNKFPWTSTNGTGVIYWMKDEWNNETQYDFKNIQFLYNDGDTQKYYYTFGEVDGSLLGNSKNNKITLKLTNSSYKVIFCESNNNSNNIIGYDIYFKKAASFNTIINSVGITFYNNCNYNYLSYCNNIKIYGSNNIIIKSNNCTIGSYNKIYYCTNIQYNGISNFIYNTFNNCDDIEIKSSCEGSEFNNCSGITCKSVSRSRFFNSSIINFLGNVTSIYIDNNANIDIINSVRMCYIMPYINTIDDDKKTISVNDYTIYKSSKFIEAII